MARISVSDKLKAARAKHARLLFRLRIIYVIDFCLFMMYDIIISDITNQVLQEQTR